MLADAKPGPSMWDPDEPLAPPSRRALRAGSVAAAWVLSAVPVPTGIQTCPAARVFHEPCPGCGMTRALKLLASGQLDASLRMHPWRCRLSSPACSSWRRPSGTTLTLGSPLHVVRRRLGRAAIGALIPRSTPPRSSSGYALFGFFGGPVPVY